MLWNLRGLDIACDYFLNIFLKNQPQAPNMMKTAPGILQSLPPPNSFNVPAQAPPPLLQAQLSAASLAPLLHNPPQPLLPQPPPKGNVITWTPYFCYSVFNVWEQKSFSVTSLDVFAGGLLQPPIRMMSQPQPVRRIEPPPRFPNRNDRGPELILRSKEERR